METIKKSRSKNQLYYGDIILIISPENPFLHKKYFFINYIGKESIELIEKSSFTKQSIGIDEQEGTLSDETIQQIKIVHRNEKKGFARQNNLLPGTFIEILFNTKIKKIITGKIINLEEDMIEVNVLDTGNSIFIDFAYRGLPPQYKIDRIKILNPSDFESINENNVNIEQEEKGEELNETGKIFDYENNNNNLSNIENINFGENVEFTETINVQISENDYRYTLKEQKESLLNDLLSSISTKDRSKRKIEKINKITNRFEQIILDYSNLNSNGNLVKNDFYDKDLPFYLNEDHNKNFKKSLHFVIPCIKEIQKVYYLNTEDQEDEEEDNLDQLQLEYPYLNLKSSFKREFIDFNEKITTFTSEDIDNNYNYYLNTLNDYLKPYIINKEENSELKLKPIYDINSNIPFLQINDEKSLLLNLPDNPLKSNIFYGTYTDYDKNMYYNDYLFMPLQFINQSIINNNTTNLLTKSLLYENYSLIDKHLSIYNSNSEIVNIDIDSSFKKSSQLYKNLDYKFDKPYIYSNKLDDINDFYNILSPDTSDVFNLYKDKNFTSYKQLFNTLETFKIFPHNINLLLLNEIKTRLSDSISYKKREYRANEKALSKKIKPIFEEDYYFLNSLYENIGEGYDILPRISEDFVLQEFINFLNNIDNMEYLHIILNQNNRKYYNPLTKEEIEKLVIDIKQGDYKSDLTCDIDIEKQKNIVKIYTKYEELINDNYKTIYIDNSINNIFSQGLNYYKKIQLRNSNNNTRKLLYKYISNEYNNRLLSDDEIEREINYIIQEQKPVLNGDYALLHEGDKKTFYIWEGDHWEKETNDECIEKKECITSDENENSCKSISKMKVHIEKDLLENYLNSIEREKIINRELLLKKIDNKQKNLITKLTLLLKIKDINDMKYHNNYLNMIDKVKTRELIISPYEELKQKILSISDESEKNKLLIQFSKKYTISGPEPHYLYCIDTNVKLLPSIQIKLAYAYFVSDEKYQELVNKLCLEQGEESDNGDAWVDKYTGYIIKKKTFEEESELDSYGNYISSKSKDEIEGESTEKQLIEKDDYDELKEREEKQRTTLAYKLLRSYSLTFMNFSGISFNKDLFDEYINHVYTVTKDDTDKYFSYGKKLEGKELKNKEKLEAKILYYCISFIFIYVQTHIPNLKIKTSFHGCKKSFNGFPLQETNEDYSGIQYISCIINNIKNNSTPWKTFSKQKVDNIRDTLIKFINKYVLVDNNITNLLIKKRGYLEERNIRNNNNLTIENSNDTKNYTLIEHFKPMDMIKYKPEELFETSYNSIPESFYQDYKKALTLIDIKEKQQYELTLKSHIDKTGLLFQAELFKKIQDMYLLLSSSIGEPFIDNACCNDKNNNPIDYFNKNDDLIKIIKYNVFYKNKLNLINNYKKQHVISFNINTIEQNILNENISMPFSEELIYLGFIKYMNFDLKNEMIPLYLHDVFKLEKPSYDSYNIKGDIEEKIKSLKIQGYEFTLNDFKRLLQLVHYQNIDNNSLANNNILNKQYNDKLLLFAQNSDIDDFIFNFINYKNGNKIFEFKQTSGSTIEIFRNDLGRHIKEYSEYNSKIIMEKINRLSKNDKLKLQTYMINNLVENKMNTEQINLNNEIFDLMKNDYFNDNILKLNYYMKFLCVILPNILLNKSSGNVETLQIPDHWIKSLSNKHILDIKSHNLLLSRVFKKLIDIDNIKDFYRENQNKLGEIYKVYNDGFYGFYTSSYDNIYKIDPTTFYQISLYFYLFTLKIYLKEFEKKSNSFMFKLIYGILTIFIDYNKDNYVSYEDVKNKISKEINSEKKRKTDRLSDLTDEERLLEKELKKNKLGVWGIGMQKGLIKYDSKFYDTERDELMETENDFESGTFFEGSSYLNLFNKQYSDLSNILETENYEGNSAHLYEEQHEATDMSAIPDDDDYGERDDLDFDLGH